MAYLGNTPAARFSAIDKQNITGDGTTGPYTLDYSVGNEQEIEVFVNNVRQEPSVAYTVSGTDLTMTGNVTSTDDFYVVFQGKAQQTATHPSSSALQATTGTFSGNVDVGGSLLVDTIKDGANTNTAMTIDSTGRILTPARPAFSGTHINSAGNTGLTGDIIMNTEDFDIGGNYDSSTGIYTVPVTGIYRYSFSGFFANSSGGNVAANTQQTVSLQTDASGSFDYYQGVTVNIASSAFYANASFSGLISATASDQLKITTLSGNHIFATNAINKVYNPRFSIELVG